MKRCRHRHTIHLRWRVGEWRDPVYGVNCTGWISPSDAAVKCRDCGAWLPLGPANDADARVALEIRAAEIADDLYESDRLCDWTFGMFGDDEERRGWSIAELNMQEHSDKWQAGYLARCIHTHAIANHEGEQG